MTTKKVAFVQTHKDRTACARYILERTAAEVMETALRRKFIGTRHLRQVYDEDYVDFQPWKFTGASEDDRGYSRRYHEGAQVGGREQKDLIEIAKERAKEVINGLPPLRKALEVIDPDSAKMLFLALQVCQHSLLPV